MVESIRAGEGTASTGPELGVDPILVAQADAPPVQPGSIDPTQPDQAPVVIEIEDGEFLRLPATASVDQPRVNGADLEFVQADGSVIVVPGGAIQGLTIFIGDIEIPPQTVAALFEANGIEAAAGPGGAGGARSSGGNFEVPVGGIGDAFDIGDLLPPTALSFGERNFEELYPTNIRPAFAFGNYTLNLSEEGLTFGLADGSPAGFDTTDLAYFLINLAASDPDGDPLTFTLGLPNIALTSNGIPVVWDGVGTDHLIGKAGGLTVLDITVGGPTGIVFVRLMQPVDHPLSGEDVIALGLAVTADDGRGGTATASLTLGIEDDSPIIGAAQAGLVDEDGLEAGIGDDAAGDDDGGSAGEPRDESVFEGRLNISWGADRGDAKDGMNEDGSFAQDGVGRSVYFSAADIAAFTDKYAEQLTSGGQKLEYDLLANGTVLTARLPGSDGEPGALIFQISLSDDESGAYRFQLLGKLDHALTSGPGTGDEEQSSEATGYEDDIVLLFDFTAKDADGDTAAGKLSVSIDDDMPVIEVLLVEGRDITHDESAWPQNPLWNFFGPSGDRDDDDVGVVASVLKVSQLFSGVTDKGNDPDVSEAAKFFFHGAIGYAQSNQPLISVDVDFGADGAAAAHALIYNLKLGSAGTSGLFTTAGEPIVLVQEDGVIVGRVGSDAGEAAFALHIDAETGKVTIAQWLSLKHDMADNHDDVISLASNSVLVEVLATDSDGDIQSATADISGQVRFEDDGPALDKFQVKSTAKIVHDETPGVDSDANDLATNAAHLFLGVPGANDPHVWGSGAIGYAQVAGNSMFNVAANFGSDDQHADGGFTFALAIGDATTSLKTTEGNSIKLELDDGRIVGLVVGGTNAGKAAFALHIDAATGDVTLVQYLSLQHTNTSSHDETTWLAANNISVKLTVTDGDSDAVSKAVNIGNKIGFQDDGPAITEFKLEHDARLVHDETPRKDGQSNDTYSSYASLFSNVVNQGGDHDIPPSGAGPIGYARVSGGDLFDMSINYGSDGENASNGRTFAFKIGSNTTSLETTEGKAIKLFLENGIIVGRYDSNNNGSIAIEDDAAFALHINAASGEMTLVQYVSIEHPIGGSSHNESIFLAANNVQVTLTAKDGDGDTTSQTINVGDKIGFKDDGPSVDVDRAETGGHHGSNVELGTLVLDESTPGGSPNDNTSNTEWSLTTNAAAAVAIGEVKTTASGNGSVASLFHIDVDGGADGVQSIVKTYGFALRDDEGDLVTNAFKGVETTLRVTDVAGTALGDLSGAERTIWLYQIDADTIIGKIHGKNGPSDNFIALKIEITGTPGNPQFTVTQYLPIEHGNGNNPDDSAWLKFDDNHASLSIKLSVTVTDKDGDTATDSESVKIIHGNKSVIEFQDDGPSVSQNAAVMLDDDDVSGAHAGNPDGVNDDAPSNVIGFLGHDFGTDGAGSILFLQQSGLPAGFTSAVSGGNKILTIQQYGVDVLKLEITDTLTGAYTITQLAAIKHAPGEDENNLVLNLRYRVTDSDGDHATGSLTVSVDDDSPTLELSLSAVDNGLFFDGFTSNGNAWGPGSGYTSGTAGAWTIAASTVSGAANVELQKVGDLYRGADSPTNSVMVDLEASPGNVAISQSISNLVDGASYRLSFEIGAASDANANSAKLDVYWNNVKVGTYDPQSGIMQTIVIDVVATGGANSLKFEEVGVSGDNTGTFLANVRVSDLIIIDETTGIQPDSDEVSGVAALFSGLTVGNDNDMEAQYAAGNGPAVFANVSYGADGPATSGALTYAFSIVPDAQSGLETTEGHAISLKLEGGRIVGVYNDGSGEKAAIALHIDAATGVVTVAQFVSLKHGDTSSHDEGVQLKAGSVSVSVTVTDGDFDSVTKTADISSTIRFEDDGPAITGITVQTLGADLIFNGGFEDGHSLSGSNWNLFDGITGWAKGTDVPFEVQTGNAGGTGNASAVIELDGDTQSQGGGGAQPSPAGTNATIQQTIAGTEAGQTYQLSFQYAPRGGTAGLTVTFEGKEVWNSSDLGNYASNTWHTITVNVKASGPNAVLAFTGTGAQDEFGALIDNVSLHTVLNGLDDDSQPLGIQGGPGDDANGKVASGTINFDAGSDGLKSIAASGIAGLKAIQVDPVTGFGTQYDVQQVWVANGKGGTLTGTIDINGAADGGIVEVYALAIDASGNYTLTIKQALVHPVTDNLDTTDIETEFEDNISLNFGYTITDGDGDTATGTLYFNVDDDTPDFVEVTDIRAANGAGNVEGTLEFHSGADGIGAIEFTNLPDGLTSGGANVQYATVGNVLIAHTGDPLNAVFTLTLDIASSKYVYEAFRPLDGETETVTIGGSTSFGAGPDMAYILTSGGSGAGEPLAIVSGWGIGGDLRTVNGSGNGWGVTNANLTSGEMLRFDFGDADDFDGAAGAYSVGAFNGPAVSEASLTFKSFDGDTLGFVVYYTDGTNSGAGSLASPTFHTFVAPVGKFIDYIEVAGTTVGGGGGKVALTSVARTNTTIDVDLNFGVTITDGDGDAASVAFTINVKDSAPTITGLSPKADGGDASVEEDGLSGGSAVGTIGEGPLSTSGSFTIASADGVESLKIGSHTIIAAGVFTVTSITTPLGNTLSITGYHPGTGVVSYSYTLLANEAHPDGARQNALFEDFAVRVEDTDGDIAIDTLSVRIVDDVPLASNEAAQNVNEGATVTGVFDFARGADGATLTHINGAEVAFDQPDNWSGWVDIGAGVLRVKANGAYEFKADNPTSGASIDVDGTFTVTDTDGDTSTANFAFDVKDANIPATGTASADVDDDGLADANPAPVVADASFSGTLGGSVGGDAPGVFSYAGLHNTPATVGLEQVTLTWDSNVLTATGTRGVVFTVTVTDPATGAYTVQLKENVLHTGGNNGENDNSVGLIYSITDADNSTTNGTLTVTFNDDVPTASDEPLVILDELEFELGMLGFVGGADGATVTHINNTELVFGAGGWSQSIETAHGTLKVQTDGAYSFTAKDNVASGSVTDSLTFTVTDSDGDTDTASLSFEVLNRYTPPIGGDSDSLAFDEDDLPAGTSPVASALVKSVALTFEAGTEDLTDFSFDTSGLAIDGDTGSAAGQITWQGAGTGLLEGFVDGVKVITLTLSGGPIAAGVSGNVTVTATLSGAFDNTFGDDLQTLLNLNAVQVVASDGTTQVTGSVNLSVVDDVPQSDGAEATAIAGVKPIVNAILVVDLSLSMNGSVGGGQTRLQLLQDAVQNLLGSSDVIYNDIVIYSFNDGATFEGRFTMNAAGAISEVNSYNSGNLVAATEYDTTAAFIRTHFTANIGATLGDADQTNLYFLTDGDPQGGSSLDAGTEQNNWLSFLNGTYNGNQIDHVYAVGFGGIVNTNYIDPMAPRDGDQAIAVTNASQLAATLTGSLPGNPSGNILDSGDKFGADGGHIASFSYDGETYTVAEDGPQIVIIDALGGKLVFNFVQNGLNAAGDWDYYAPDNSDGVLEFDYVLVDNDGDEAGGTLTINVELPPNAAPTSSDDSITMDEDTTKVLALSDFGNYQDGDSDPLVSVKITSLETDGALQFDSTGGGSWEDVVLNQEVSAAHISAGRLRFAPDANESAAPYATIGFQVGDGTAFSGTYTLTINVTDVPEDAAPVITGQSTIQYWSENISNAPVTYLNRVGFQDYDGNATVRVSFTSASTSDTWTANLSAFALTAISDSSGVFTVEGTYSDINHWLANNGLAWNPGGISNNTGPTGREITIAVDANLGAPGGIVASKVITLEAANPTLNGSTTNLAAWNLNGNVDVYLGNGADTIITSWSHGPSSTNVQYDGENGSDTLVAVFTSEQLNTILSNEGDRNELLGFFDGSPTSGNDELDVGSAWNAETGGDDFESANIAIAAGHSKHVVWSAIEDGDGDAVLPQDDSSPDNDTNGDLVRGNGNDNTLSGGGTASDTANNGNDFLVGLGGDDILWGGGGSDLLLGGDGDDTLRGGNGNDILSGGRGADTFHFTNSGAGHADFIVDYSFVDGDVVDLSELLAGITDGNVNDHVKLVQEGTDVRLSVDTNGTSAGGESYVATLVDYATTDNVPIKVLIDGDEYTLTI